ncbi:S-layer homology domain-containing protein [Desertifilum sp. FACHB-1129]|uniref:SLH domain-containing protein n=1 Tax=Desertifilum tharense IPPAS B-1220 TaxID=1781255 RepID=A0A1E5QRE2_9CYAN|nr:MULTISPECIES: S-layer homology domain-containing protein [Desertifilum]MDA0208658.1 S-layer homology domain-containing protein [Cyanobacteria bacterium FC1]MBD2310858.1 S-layer homology domain-containing protein [Desertifilum sp. FACHB-1129]MBD2321261.1 S-layer homology domain-containing protein [Desertifilum sp. FACHB-866]MBD2331432.1 S-layer homology domain-containing protein [Desertifilum sp. FACHB-868]OEJ77201.1 hypothetical protein BH720_00550 [Desertifilum tharense IPPAS B-1220]
MSNLPEPNSDPSNRNPLGFDDWIGVLIAFATIGTILGWALLQGDRPGGFLDRPLLGALPAASPQATPQPLAPGLQDPRTPTVSPQRPAARPTPTADPRAAVVPRTPTPAATASPSPRVLPLPLGVPTTPESPRPAVVAPVETTPSPEVSPTPTPISQIFTDIPEGYWAVPFIAALSQRDIIVGYRDRTYRPDRPVTRAEFATMLQRSFVPDDAPTPEAYTDIAQDYWALDSIRSSTQTGFLRGYPDRTFRPDQPITRLQVGLALASGLQLQPPQNPQETLGQFEDAGEIPEYARPAIAAATQAGILVNHPEPNRFNPQQEATRAEVAAMLYQALVNAGQAEPLEPQ